MKTLQDIGPYEYAHFDGLDQLMRQIENEANTRSVNDDIYTRVKASKENGHTWETIQQAMKTPPPASIDVISIMQGLANTAGAVTRRRLIRRREDGDELDPVAWVHRELDGWSRMERRPEPRQVISICCNCSILATTLPAALRYRGGATAAIVDALEMQGHSVSVTMSACQTDLYATRQTGKLTVMDVMLKNAEEPLDINTIAFALSDSGFYRIAVFMARTQIVGARKASGGLGQTANLPPEYSEQFDIVLDADILTEEAAAAAVKKYTA